MSGRADLERRLARLEALTAPVEPQPVDTELIALCGEVGIPAPEPAQTQDSNFDATDWMLWHVWGLHRPHGPDPVTFVDPDPDPDPERKDSSPDAA